MQQLFAVLVPEVVLQLQVSQSTDQDLVAFQVKKLEDFSNLCNLITAMKLNQQQKPPGHEFTLGTKHAFQYGIKKPFRSGCDGLCGAKWQPVRCGKTMATWPPVTYLCTGKYVCALEIYLCTGK